MANRVFNALERFLHVEALSGIVLLAAAAVALVWANFPGAVVYEHFWGAPVSFGFAGQQISQPLRFWINDGLMTIFFLVVGLEIRREIYEGALANVRLAALPVAAALGGVAAPALIYAAINPAPELRQGWAIPTATDIAFAVGVLALLGKSIPSAVRVLLLALAIIDDILAVLIIAIFYSSGLDVIGISIALIGVLLVLLWQRLGAASALSYAVPGAVVWVGLLVAGVHPTLAGVILGLMTPAAPLARGGRPIAAVTLALNEFERRVHSEEDAADPRTLLEAVKRLKRAQRATVPPVIRVEAALHPWVAYGIMPLFALANAGVAIGEVDWNDSASRGVLLGVLVGLMFGKPFGIVLASWLAVRLGLCRLAPDVNWRGIWLVGCLGGIGFTMSVFIANLAFVSDPLLNAAKLGVLVASGCAAALGVAVGKLIVSKRAYAAHTAEDAQ